MFKIIFTQTGTSLHPQEDHRTPKWRPTKMIVWRLSE